MSVTEDYMDYFFEAEYRFVSASSMAAIPPVSIGTQPTASDGQKTNQQSAAAAAAAAAQACHGSSHSLSDSSRLSRLQERRLRGTSGEISLRSPPISPEFPLSGMPGNVVRSLNIIFPPINPIK